MKICVISSSVFTIGGFQGLTNYGGLEVVAWHCARGLAARGHKVTLIAPQGSTCPGCEVIPCLPPGMGEEQSYGGCILKNQNNEDVRWPGYWQKLLDFNIPDGVIIDHSWNCWPALLKMEGRLKCPILKVLHAPVNNMINSIPPEGVVSFICISEDQKNHFEALFSPRRAQVAYNGIDLDVYKPLSVPRSDRFLFLARFSAIKGAAIGLEACKQAGVGLDLIGDTTITGEPEYFQHCQSLCDGKHRKIIGGVQRGQAVWWMSQAHAFLHPNKTFREPFGLSPVEAQACGCPVISFNYGAMRETVKQGATGWLVDTEKEFTNFVREVAKGVPDGVRRQCIQWAATFSMDNMVSRYESLCQEALTKVW